MIYKQPTELWELRHINCTYVAFWASKEFIYDAEYTNNNAILLIMLMIRHQDRVAKELVKWYDNESVVSSGERTHTY